MDTRARATIAGMRRRAFRHAGRIAKRPVSKRESADSAAIPAESANPDAILRESADTAANFHESANSAAKGPEIGT